MIRIMDGHLLSAHVEPVRQSQRDFVEQTAAWLAPFARAGVVRKLPARLYAALVVGPSRDFLRIWLTDRDPALIKTAGKVFPAAAWRSIASDDAA